MLLVDGLVVAGHGELFGDDGRPCEVDQERVHLRNSSECSWGRGSSVSAKSCVGREVRPSGDSAGNRFSDAAGGVLRGGHFTAGDCVALCRSMVAADVSLQRNGPAVAGPTRLCR